MIDLTKEAIIENAKRMEKAEECIKEAISQFDETCAWLETSFAGQNELVWITSVNNQRSALSDAYELAKKQAEKLNQIAELFDPEV